MDAAERKHLAGLTATVERETQATTERRAIIAALRADASKVASLKIDAETIRKYWRSLPPLPRFENAEVIRLFDAIVHGQFDQLRTLAGEIST